MSSRQEEKQRRREEREAQERAAQASATRSRRLQMVGGGILVVAAIAVVIVLVAGGSGGNDGPSSEKTRGVAIPAAGPNASGDKLPQAAKAAGCVAKTFPSYGRNHVTTTVNYKTNPPTSGNHTPVWYQDGIYAPGDVPRLGMIVHPLEHGRIELQYKPGTPKATVKELEALYKQENGGYHMLLFQNTTKMPFQVAAAAWGHYVGCPKMNDKVFDALRTFHDQYIDKGPEIVP